MNIDPLKQLYNDFMTIIADCVIKYKGEADKGETLDIKKAADAYIKAYRGEDVFETYYRYDTEILMQVMSLPTEEDALYYKLNRMEIPLRYRGMLVQKQREKVLKEYVEENNYYRCLAGLPNIEDTQIDFIYIDESIAGTLGVPSDIPIHEMDEHYTAVIQSTGVLDTLKAKYPTKKYLNYVCGNTKIDIVTARTAKAFSVLRVPASINASLKESFSLIYEQCREYFMSCIYITEYRNIIDYYDNFIAMCIMLMCMQQVMSRTIKDVIDRNFYDEYCVRLLFETYGVPYNAYMDTQTRTMLIQNLNLLVQNKGTNKVVRDIASILGYDRIQIYKYYLMKTQNFDVNGMPIVSCTTDPVTGEKTYNYTEMFTTYFQKVALDEDDIYQSLIDTANYVPYNEITYPDPYWVEDADLQKELYESEYNFVESKYMGVSISYRLSRILFENVYLLRMLFEKKDEMASITLDLPKITEYSQVTLFDAVVILCAMTCKQNHLRGEIIMQPSGILHVMGFDFVNNFQAIREEIEKNPYVDNDILTYFVNSTTYTAESVNNLYHNYLDLYDILLERMTTTNDIKVYQAYKDLYETIFYNQESERMFNIGTLENPIYASTYMEYLQHTNPEVYDFINEVDSDMLYSYINHIAQKMTTVISDLKYIGAMSDGSSTMETMLIELIRFFKSYTTDMLGFETIYILDLKPDSLMRLIDWVSLHVNLWIDDQFQISYADTVHYTSTVHYASYLKWMCRVKAIHAGLWLFDSLKFHDTFHVYANLYVGSDMKLYDVLQKMYDQIQLESRLEFKEVYQFFIHARIDDKITFEDFCHVTSIVSANTGLTLYDVVKLYAVVRTDDKFHLFDDILKVVTKTSLTDELKLRDEIDRIVHIYHVQDATYVYDVLKIYTSMMAEEKLYLLEKYMFFLIHYLEDKLYLIDRIKAIIYVLREDDRGYLYDMVYNRKVVQEKEELLADEKWSFYVSNKLADNFCYLDRVTHYTVEEVLDHLYLYDVLYAITISKQRDAYTLEDKCWIQDIIPVPERTLLYQDQLTNKKHALAEDIYAMGDEVHPTTTIHPVEKLPLHEVYQFTITEKMKDTMKHMWDEYIFKGYRISYRDEFLLHEKSYLKIVERRQDKLSLSDRIPKLSVTMIPEEYLYLHDTFKDSKAMQIEIPFTMMDDSYIHAMDKVQTAIPFRDSCKIRMES